MAKEDGEGVRLGGLCAGILVDDVCSRLVACTGGPRAADGTVGFAFGSGLPGETERCLHLVEDRGATEGSVGALGTQFGRATTWSSMVRFVYGQHGA